MTERSRFWDGTSIGDATVAPYDAADEFAAVQRSLAAAAGVPTDLSGVCRDELNEGTAVIGANTVTVDTLRALVHGTWYEADIAVAVTVPTPGGATRFDRIVLRKDWTAKTVRITRIAGAEGAGVPPALGAGTPVYTQNSASGIWDVTLYTVSITTAGVIVVTDTRKYVPLHGNQSAEGGTHHAFAQLTGSPASTATVPTTPNYGAAPSAGTPVNEWATPTHIHGEDEETRGILIRTGGVTLSGAAQAMATLPLLASGTYYIEGHVTYTAIGVAGDLLLSFTFPAGATLSLYAVGYDPTDNITPKVVGYTVASSPDSFGAPADTIRDIYYFGTVVVVGTPGNIVALAASGTAGTAGTYMKATRI